VSTSPVIGTPTPSATAPPAPRFLADVYTFNWSALRLGLPLVSASSVALCLIVGVAVGHPGGALLTGGGALTVGFGVNQCIADSRILPMLAAVFAIATATFAGTIVGHSNYTLVVAAAASAAIYGVLTVRHAGLAWVGQQASITLFVASAFPLGLHYGLVRAGLIALGGAVQVIITSASLRLIPALSQEVADSPCAPDASVEHKPFNLISRFADLPSVLPNALPLPDRIVAIRYAIRLSITVALASELYHRLGIQAGYWIPMTALLVQKPAFFETLARAITRTGGTILGATLATVIASHLRLSPWTIVTLIVFFAFWCFATISVNYAVFSVCITSYIVFLLSLNQIPGSLTAYRRAYCTTFGAIIALLLHLDVLRRSRSGSAQ
jgi:Fusaric acid resistance protein-like